MENQLRGRVLENLQEGRESWLLEGGGEKEGGSAAQVLLKTPFVEFVLKH